MAYRQALFAVVGCIFCLESAVLAGKVAGYDLGYAAGLYAGSQTISASMASRPTPSTGLVLARARPRICSTPMAIA
jgi:putative transport protein